MARFNKMQVLDAIVSTGMVPVYYNKDVEIAKQVVKACYEGGVRAFEFTNRGDFAHEVFAELIKFATKNAPNWYWRRIYRGCRNSFPILAIGC